MKDCSRARIYCLFAAIVLLCAPCRMHAQVEGLPIKPGLWENTVTMSGGMGGAGRTMSSQACYSAKMTVDQYLALIQQKTPGIECTVSNKKVTAHLISLDESCSGNGMAIKTHEELQIIDPEHVSSKGHSEMTGAMQGQPMNMTMDMTHTAKFVSSDCGAVKPLVVPPAK